MSDPTAASSDVTTALAVVGAVAALSAALFSGLTLWLSGQREERKWRRETMTNLLVQFLDASFGGRSRHALEDRRAGHDTREAETLIRGCHATQLTTLTRLRLLAPRQVVDRAEALHVADRAVHELALLGPGFPSDADWERARQEQTRCRNALLEASRKHLRLGPTRAIRNAGRL